MYLDQIIALGRDRAMRMEHQTLHLIMVGRRHQAEKYYGITIYLGKLHITWIARGDFRNSILKVTS
jgi:hypothetical protein